jgi:hypothetical protein
MFLYFILYKEEITDNKKSKKENIIIKIEKKYINIKIFGKGLLIKG